MGILSTLFSTSALEYLKPDLVLLLVLYVALRRSFAEGGILSLCFGYLAELHSTLPKGGGLAIAMGLFLSIHVLRRYLLIPVLRPPLWIFPFSTLIGKVALLGVLQALGLAHSQWKQTLLWIGLDMLIDSLVGIWLFPILGKFDWHTFKDPRALQAMDGELVLEEEAS
jgi:hypothetical protein